MAFGGPGSPELASCQLHHLKDDSMSFGASSPGGWRVGPLAGGGGGGGGRRPGGGQNAAFAQGSDSSVLQAGAALTSCLSGAGRGDGWSGISKAIRLPQWSPHWRHTSG